MNVALWIVQGLLALMFLMAGATKLSKPKNELREKLGEWVDQYSSSTLKLIGLLELLGALGLILPMSINFLSVLTPVAAIGLAITMLGAMKVHADRKEQDKVKMNLVLLVLALFVAAGRFFIVPVI
ncbi:MAG: DoxX family protein [Cytophagales bacterium]|nr:DoxX family protein [Cytophagales bacterium]